MWSHGSVRLMWIILWETFGCCINLDSLPKIPSRDTWLKMMTQWNYDEEHFSNMYPRLSRCVYHLFIILLDDENEKTPPSKTSTWPWNLQKNMASCSQRWVQWLECSGSWRSSSIGFLGPFGPFYQWQCLRLQTTKRSRTETWQLGFFMVFFSDMCWHVLLIKNSWRGNS